MPRKSQYVSFRLSSELHSKLEARAARAGQSAGLFVRELTTERLLEDESQAKGWVELFAEMRRTRSDLALATEVILAVCSDDKDAPAKAKAWVRNNLNCS